jgi:aryl-alcohol dehydrogenase-like predicted oxidoreductase
MPLPTRQLGPFAVSAIGLGCMNLSHAYGTTPSPAEGAALLNRALDLGVTLLDTAALYGGGDNERLVAEVMPRRDEFTLASKCVLDMRGGKRVLDGSPFAIDGTLDAALQRLRTDHIDLYYLHRLDPNVPIEDSVGALVRARDAGKIGAIGLSEMSAATIRRAHAVHPIAAVQSEYSPAVRNPEVAVLQTCRDLGISFVAFSPLARGLLAGSIDSDAYEPGDIRTGMPRFVEPQLSQNLEVARQFNAIAGQAGLTPAQLSLAWVMAQADSIIPIPGTRSMAHLEENVGAGGVTLGADVIGAVDALLPANRLAGARYAAAAQAQIDTELLPGEPLA